MSVSSRVVWCVWRLCCSSSSWKMINVSSQSEAASVTWSDVDLTSCAYGPYVSWRLKYQPFWATERIRIIHMHQSRPVEGTDDGSPWCCCWVTSKREVEAMFRSDVKTLSSWTAWDLYLNWRILTRSSVVHGWSASALQHRAATVVNISLCFRYLLRLSNKILTRLLSYARRPTRSRC